jgi:hypothetical protein
MATLIPSRHLCLPRMTCGERRTAFRLNEQLDDETSTVPDFIRMLLPSRARQGATLRCQWHHQYRAQEAMNRTEISDPMIMCPQCRTEIRLTESLAAPLIAATRQQYERQLREKDEDIFKREQNIRDREKQILDARRTLDEQIADQVAARLKTERQRVMAATSTSPRF